MPRESDANATGPVSRAICVFQEKWVLHIVHTLLDGPRGFNELGRDVGGCNPSTLNQRLARLEEMGLVRRSTECEGGRSAYRLTEAGEALREVIGAIRAWSTAHLTENGVAHGFVVDVPTAASTGGGPSLPPAAREPAVPRAARGASVAARMSAGQARLRAGDEGEARAPLVAKAH